MQCFFALFLLLVMDSLAKGLVQFLNPSLDAPEVERSVALLAVPQERFLVNLVLTDDTFLGACGE